MLDIGSSALKEGRTEPKWLYSRGLWKWGQYCSGPAGDTFKPGCIALPHMTDIAQILCFFSQNPSATPVYFFSKNLGFLSHLHTEMTLMRYRPYLFLYFSYPRPTTFCEAHIQQCWSFLFRQKSHYLPRSVQSFT